MRQDSIRVLLLIGAAIRQPVAFFKNEASRIIFRLGRPSVVHRDRDFSSLKDIIFGIPRENQERVIRYLCEDRKDGSDLPLF
jgi:hypothetical protein